MRGLGALRPFLSGGTVAGVSLFFCLSASAADEAVRDAVRFVAWNLRNFVHVAHPAPPGGTAAKPREAVSAVVEVLAAARPDVVGLCEMGSREDFEKLRELLREEGVDLPYGEWVEAADPVRHLALLSRYPIVARTSQAALFYQLDTARHPVQRGILDVTLQVTADWRLRCCGVHLKSRREVPEADEGLMRRNEAHLLRGVIDGILTAEPDANLLVYGDFNEERTAASLRAVRGGRGGGPILTEIPCADDRGDRWTYHYPEDDSCTRIDFLMASPGLLPEVDERSCAVLTDSRWRLASDHRPLLGVFRPAGASGGARGR